MDSRPDQQPEVQWLLSGWDFWIHAFPLGTSTNRDYLEAACRHSVPPPKIVPASDTVLDPEYCPTCFRLYADTFPRRDENLHD